MIRLAFFLLSSPFLYAISLDQAAQEIVEAGQFLNQQKLCPATSGNLSVRIDHNLVAMTVSGKHKGELTADDVMRVDLNGNPVGSAKKPSAETLLHTLIYSLDPQAGAVLHTHTLSGTILSRLVAPEKALITQGYEIHKVFPGITTHESALTIPIFENSQDMRALAIEVGDYLKAHPQTYGFLVRGHGLYTWGRDMKEVKNRVEAFEYLFDAELCQRKP